MHGLSFTEHAAEAAQAARRGETGQAVLSGLKAGGRGVQALNPMSKRNILMRMVGKANRTGEDLARWALFSDRLRKGYTARAAARAVAKYIFNYDEISRFGQVAKRFIPFATWNLKNWGMQISTLLNKPDKLVFREIFEAG